ncbi:MAG: laminin B domain-containing protein [Myxococcales bacterium]|nr:laminin B domain-containing protein [Myxococcales bacterium]
MRLPLVLTFCFVTLACGPSVPSYASSLFEGDDETWLISGNGDSTRPTFMATGGNGGNGNICATDATREEFFYFVAPPKFLGNVSSTYGTRVTFDLKTSSQFMLLKGRDVVLNGGGLALVQNFKDVPGRDWSPRSFALDDKSGWLLDGSGELATEEQVRTVLRNLTAIRIRGEFVDSPRNVTCLDNVYFGTP